MIYKDLSDNDKKQYLIHEYEILGKSFIEIAKANNTYANKLRRDAIKYKINIRDKSTAQKKALESGRTNHPTKGKERSSHTKDKIGLSVLKSWENLTEDQINERKDKAKLNWQNKSEDEKQNLLREANVAVREASKFGSKLEKFLLHELLNNGYVVEFHKEQSILNTKLQIDIFLPSLNIAIEVDGPSHFSPVWGNDALNRNRKYDNKKSGLVLGKGWYLVRVKQLKDFSKSRASLIFKELVSTIEQIKSKTIGQNKIIIIGDK